MIDRSVRNFAPYMLVGFAALIAALTPLHEMDLAQHLAMGEWIVRERAVPFTEPFAWTRQGEPYFAYSWLAQVLFFGLLEAFGPIGLHLLEGVLVGGAVAAVLWAAKQSGWTRAACIGLAALYLCLLWGVANILRPQQFLFVLLPLAWGVAARIRAAGTAPLTLVALFVISAIAANTHIFFPLVLAPVAYFWLAQGQTRRWLLAAAAVLAGWLLNPYALVLPQVFELNFGHNALLGRPPSIAEFVPGFEYALQRPGVVAAAVVLIAAPWLVQQPDKAPRAQMTHLLFWVVGLLLFAYAGRLIFVAWILNFALLGEVVQTATRALGERLKTPFATVAFSGVAAIMLVVAAPSVSPVFWLFEGDTRHRMLPRAGEDPALWLPSWLLCNTQSGARGRIFTEFNYGSELNWRLPGYSASIDGRTIFPDSVAIDFVYHPYGRRRAHASTWTRADLALLDRSFWLAPVLDQDSTWLLAAESRSTSRGGPGALWVKKEWWRQWGTTQDLPAREIRTGDSRAMCNAAGFFPKRKREDSREQAAAARSGHHAHVMEKS